MYSYGPSGDLMVAQPIFRMCVAPEGNAQITDAVMEVNGNPVASTYSQQSGRLEFRPSAPLPPGPVDVTAKIVIDRKSMFQKSWTAMVRTDAAPEYLEPSAAALESLRVVNELRRATGLDPVVTDRCLSHVAQLHSQYLNQNKRTGHAQEESGTGFFGRTLRDRLNKFGWNEAASEAVVHNLASPRESVEAAFAAPYHRLPFLAPGPIEAGAGMSGESMSLIFGHSSKSGVVLSPSVDQKQVPASWFNSERPNPLRFFESAGSIVGYPIVIAEFGHKEKLTVVEAKLTTGAESIDVFVVDGSKDESLKATAFVIPARPLRKGTEYNVLVRTARASGATELRTWSFTTK